MRPILLMATVALGLSGCDRFPGQPTAADRWQAPTAISDFKTLYTQNCLGCHGDGQSIAGSITMKNPVYLQILPEAVLRQVVSVGIPGSNMPAFAVSSGGQLSDAQIDVLVQGILAWKDPKALPAAPIPAYSAALGDVAAGAEAFALACGSCHGTEGNGGEKAGSVVNPKYLDLVSNQYLRTVTIAGRPELGCPDFAHRIPGRAMDAAAVANIVAWLDSHRRNEFGKPMGPRTSP